MELLTVQEQIIMGSIWKSLVDLSMKELIKAVSIDCGELYNRSTIRSFVYRLENKGYLTTYKVGRECKIHAIISGEDYIYLIVKNVAHVSFLRKNNE